MFSVRNSVEWPELRLLSGLPCDSCDALCAELGEWSKAVSSLQECLAAMHTKLDLEDQRRSI